MKGDSLRMSEEIKSPQVVDLGPCALQKFDRMNHERETLCPADGNVETVGVEKEFRAARRFDAFRGRH